MATLVGGTTQDLRTWRGPEGDNFQPRNPPEKESRARRYRVHARTVWQVSDVGRLYVRCQIFQWASPWCRMTGVWPDRRMSADFTRGDRKCRSTLGFQRRTRKPLFLKGRYKGFLSMLAGIWRILVKWTTKSFGAKRMVKSEAEAGRIVFL